MRSDRARVAIIGAGYWYLAVTGERAAMSPYLNVVAGLCVTEKLFKPSSNPQITLQI